MRAPQNLLDRDRNSRLRRYTVYDQSDRYVATRRRAVWDQDIDLLQTKRIAWSSPGVLHLRRHISDECSHGLG